MNNEPYDFKKGKKRIESTLNNYGSISSVNSLIDDEVYDTALVYKAPITVVTFHIRFYNEHSDIGVKQYANAYKTLLTELTKLMDYDTLIEIIPLRKNIIFIYSNPNVVDELNILDKVSDTNCLNVMLNKLLYKTTNEGFFLNAAIHRSIDYAVPFLNKSKTNNMSFLFQGDTIKNCIAMAKYGTTLKNSCVLLSNDFYQTIMNDMFSTLRLNLNAFVPITSASIGKCYSFLSGHKEFIDYVEADMKDENDNTLNNTDFISDGLGTDLTDLNDEEDDELDIFNKKFDTLFKDDDDIDHDKD